MSKKMRVFTSVVTVVLFCGMALAQRPAENISPKVHPNLAQAQRLIAQANEYIARAQKANRGDMQDHAEKARQLLVQADQELKAAAEASNAAGNKKKGKR